MSLYFCRQTPNVAFRLQVCAAVVANMEGEDREQLESALRSFEEVATVMEITANGVVAAAHGERLAKAEVRMVLDLVVSMVTPGTTLEGKLDQLVKELKEMRPRCGMTEVRPRSRSLVHARQRGHNTPVSTMGSQPCANAALDSHVENNSSGSNGTCTVHGALKAPSREHPASASATPWTARARR